MRFKCSSIGRVRLRGHLEFTTIDLFPKIFVTRRLIYLANEVLLKTYRHCIVANSIKPCWYTMARCW